MKIAMRVDASFQIGSGHLMRCLTLADALKERNVTTRFVCRHIPDGLKAMIEQKGHQLIHMESGAASEANHDLPHSDWLGTSQAHDANDTLRALSGQLWDWIVVDHYALDAYWESAMRRSAKHIMVIDDIADRRHDCDVLLDQNLYAGMELRYAGKVPPHCQLLLGPRYALLRDEFQQLRLRVKPKKGPVERVLVFFGGVDATNYTATAIDVLANLETPSLHVDVVIGSQHPNRAEIEAACSASGYGYHIQTEKMPELMANADMAIGAGGSASWERCALGLPTLAISAAANQDRLIQDAAAEGLLYAPSIQRNLAETLSRHVPALLENPALRYSISRNGMNAVDGRGVYRVLSLLDCTDISMRSAGPDDVNNLFEWRNHPSIRSVSRDSEPIAWEDHQRWFNAVLADKDRVLLIGLRHRQAIGVVRFDLNGESGEVSIYLVPEVHGPGLGSALLLEAERWLGRHRREVATLKAMVLGGNQPSHRMFSNNGYEIESTCYYKRMRSL